MNRQKVLGEEKVSKLLLQFSVFVCDSTQQSLPSPSIFDATFIIYAYFHLCITLVLTSSSVGLCP